NQNLKLNFVWNRKFPDWNRPKWWKMADSRLATSARRPPAFAKASAGRPPAALPKKSARTRFSKSEKKRKKL
ncbi:hypothetical protein COS78_00410, partial [Candidatus Shapirobacteria bacterium CG06_land_8_20_14_3_00_40_12]